MELTKERRRYSTINTISITIAIKSHKNFTTTTATTRNLKIVFRYRSILITTTTTIIYFFIIKVRYTIITTLDFNTTIIIKFLINYQR